MTDRFGTPAVVAGFALALLLSACGGGGGGKPSAPAVTPLPTTLSLTGPASGDISAEVQFGSNASSAGGLRFAWDFGDGTTSTEASPRHSFSQVGDYEVLLKVTNEAGASIEQRRALTVTNLAHVRGLVCSGANSGGWCWQRPRTTDANTGAAMLDASTAIVVTDRGHILKTTDAGETWVQLSSGYSTPFYKVAFTSPTEGWVFGVSGDAVTKVGTLLRTTDAGATWTRKTNPPSFSWWPVYDLKLIAIDASTAVFVDDGHDIFVTKDVGETWAANAYEPRFGGAPAFGANGDIWYDDQHGAVTRAPDYGAFAVQVLDYNEPGFPNLSPNQNFRVLDERTIVLNINPFYQDPVTGAVSRINVIWLSTDAGATWKRTVVKSINGAAVGNTTIRVIRASSADSVLLAEVADSICRSEDGGVTWSCRSDLPYIIEENSVTLDPQTVLLPGSQCIYRTEDTGKTWSKVVMKGAQLQGPPVVRGDVVSARDYGGQLYVSTDRGKTWKTVVATARGGDHYGVSVSFFDGKRGLLLTNDGQLLETKDGGLNWLAKLNGLTPGVGTLNFVDAKTGWMLLADGLLYKTSDGGASWSAGQEVRSGGLDRIGFVDSKRGWGRRSEQRGNQTDHYFVLTTDGGRTWTDVRTAHGNMQAIHIGPGQRLVGYGRFGFVSVSTDAGKTWTNSTLPGSEADLAKVVAQDANTLWAIGTAYTLEYTEVMRNSTQLWKSTDGGVQWELALTRGPGLQFNDVAFVGAKNGWVVGNVGTILATTDGGKTWVPQDANTESALQRIVATDSKTAWISNDGGLLLSTGTGGN